MADKPVVRIPVSTEEWDAFVDSFMRYQSVLEQQPEAWAGTNKGIRQTQNAFSDVEKTFAKVARLAIDPKLTGQSSGVFVRIKKDAKETEKSWRNISHEIERAGKGMAGLLRNGLSFSSLGLFGAVGGVIGAAGTATNAAVKDLAEQNAQNRALGLAPGEEKAFDIEYGRAGGTDELLAKIATAKSDPTKWKGLIAGGLTQDEIRGQDPEQLAAEFMQRAGAKFNSAGTAGGTWAERTGVTDYLGTNQLRQAGTYSAEDYKSMQTQYETEQKKLAASQAKYDEATQKMAELQGDFAEIELNIELSLLKLAPEFEKLAKEAAQWAKDFADSGELEQDVQTFESAVHDIAGWAKWLDDKLNSLFGLTGQKPKPGESQMYNAEQGSFGANMVQGAKNVYSALTDQSLKDWNAGPGPAIGMGSGGDTGTGGNASEAHILDAIMMNESSGINGKTNKKSGAAGLYGITPDNYQRDHVDPMDPVQARAEAQKIYEGFLNKYHDPAMALAAYDGFGGLDRDIAKYGDDWRDHISEFQKGTETTDYLNRIEKQGISLSKADAQVQALDPNPQIIPYDEPKGGLDANPQIVPYDGGGDDAGSPGYRNINGLDDLAANMKKLLGDTFGEGAGSKYARDDRTAQRIDRQGNQPFNPYKIDVVVTAPAGTNAAVTAGGIAK